MPKQLIKLETFNLVRCHIDWRDVPKNTPVLEADLRVRLRVGQFKKSQRKFRLYFAVQVNQRIPKGREAGHLLDTEVFGDFVFPPRIDADKMQHHLCVNGGMILYGILRGQIALLTAAFPGRGLALPCIDMEEVVQQMESADASKKTPAKKKSVEKRKAGAKKRPVARKKTPSRSRPTTKKRV